MQLDIDAVLIKCPDVAAQGVELIVFETIEHLLEMGLLILKGKVELDTAAEDTDQARHAKNIDKNAMEQWVVAKHGYH